MDYEIDYDEHCLIDEELTAEVEYDEPPLPWVPEWVVRLSLPGCKDKATIPASQILTVVQALLDARLTIFCHRFQRWVVCRLRWLAQRLNEICLRLEELITRWED